MTKPSSELVDAFITYMTAPRPDYPRRYVSEFTPEVVAHGVEHFLNRLRMETRSRSPRSTGTRKLEHEALNVKAPELAQAVMVRVGLI